MSSLGSPSLCLYSIPILSSTDCVLLTLLLLYSFVFPCPYFSLCFSLFIFKIWVLTSSAHDRSACSLHNNTSVNEITRSLYLYALVSINQTCFQSVKWSSRSLEAGERDRGGRFSEAPRNASPAFSSGVKESSVSLSFKSQDTFREEIHHRST